MTLSNPVKIVALAALALALGAAGVFTLVARGGSSSPPSTPPAVVKVIPVASSHTTPLAHPKPKLVLDPNLPAPVSHGLRLSKEVVAFVYSPASATDRALLAEVRAGAHAAKVGFVALDVQKESVAAAVYGWSSSTADPAVLVVRRPGKVVFSLNGPTDRDSVAAAAAAR